MTDIVNFIKTWAADPDAPVPPVVPTEYALLAVEEIERLRNRIAQLEQALDALGYMKAINTITAELGPKASTPNDIADALRKVVGR